MTRDQTLLPKQVLRLCALGTVLQRGPLPYADLAETVRDFTAHLIGPSLDMMGSSLELLRYDGLIAPVDGDTDDDGTALEITDAGRTEFRALMATSLPTPASELSKLVVALKVRFLHLLPATAGRAEIAGVIERYEREIGRLADLRQRQAGEPGNFDAWLQHDIDQNRRRLDWFRDLLSRL